MAEGCYDCDDYLEKMGFVPGEHKTIPELVREGRFVTCLAPMVRYSRLPFRMLCRKWGCDTAYTPMLMADSFILSRKARDADLTTNRFDRPLVIQFAAHEPVTFGIAAKLVAKECDGVDLNCGCPESWVNKQGDGAALLEHPELVADMVKQAVNQMEDLAIKTPISIKIRPRRDINQTIEMAQRAEHCGCAYIAMHGRHKSQGRGGPIDYDAIRTVKDSVKIPVIANGGLNTPETIATMREKTGVDGVMSGLGLLNNPSMFLRDEAGTFVSTKTPVQCIHDFVGCSSALGMQFCLVQRHLTWMTHLMHPSAAKRREFNVSKSLASSIEYIKENFPLE